MRRTRPTHIPELFVQNLGEVLSRFRTGLPTPSEIKCCPQAQTVAVRICLATRAIEFRSLIEYHANQLRVVKARQTLLQSFHWSNSLPNNQERAIHQS